MRSAFSRFRDNASLMAIGLTQQFLTIGAASLAAKVGFEATSTAMNMLTTPSFSASLLGLVATVAPAILAAGVAAKITNAPFERMGPAVKARFNQASSFFTQGYDTFASVRRGIGSALTIAGLGAMTLAAGLIGADYGRGIVGAIAEQHHNFGVSMNLDTVQKIGMTVGAAVGSGLGVAFSSAASGLIKKTAAGIATPKKRAPAMAATL